MAMRVPELQQQFRYESPNVPAARLQGMNVQTSAAMFGGDSGRQMEKAGYMLQRGAEQTAHLVDDYNNTKAREGASQFQQDFLAWQTEAAKKVGKDGASTGQDYDTWAQQRAGELTKDMSSVQRGRFESIVGERMALQKRWAEGYGQEQDVVHKTSLFKAEMSGAGNLIATNPGDPGMVAQAMKQIDDAAYSLAKLKGLDEKAGIEFMREAVDTHLGGTIHNMIQQGQTGAASNLIKQYGDQLGGMTVGKLNAAMTREREHQEAKARAFEDRAKEAQANSRYTEFYTNLKELPLDEKTAAGMEVLEGIEDPKVKTRMLARFRQDIGMETVRQNAQASVQVRQFKEAAHKQGWLPSQSLTALEQMDGLLPQAREHLRKELAGEERKPTKENIAKSNELLRLIDKQEVADDRGIDAFAWENGLTDTQTERARKYHSDGGNKSQVSMSRVEQLYKKMNKGGKAPEWLFDAVRENLEPGKAVTEEHVRKTIANLYMDGKTDGSGWFSDKEKYISALREGRGDDWLPDVSDAEKKEISVILRGQGVRVTDERICQYKKKYIMGIGREVE